MKSHLTVAGKALLVLFVISLFIPIIAKYNPGTYQERHIECNYQSLTEKLGKAFGLEFPKASGSEKAAKTIPTDGTLEFIVVISGEHAVVDAFLKQVEQADGRWEEHDRWADAGRLGWYGWPMPKWFTRPISEGMNINFWNNDGDMNIYVDTSDPTCLHVYIRGWISPKYLEE